MKILKIAATSAFFLLVIDCTHSNKKEFQTTDSVKTDIIEDTRTQTQITSDKEIDSDIKTNSSTSASGNNYESSYYGDDVDEMYEGVAEQTKADLREACREVGADYYDLFDDAEIDQQVEELKAETRKQMRELGY
ncbi:MAG: hypothetical protein NC402_05440 [Prevotella sp.]|nr:hypothetical protein [Prevotella sp.]MCM1075252.1 hypothetical protein [Ruminococcus sp.]